MLATDRSSPRAIIAETGNQIARAFEDSVEQPEEMYTAIHSSQLHSIERMKRVLNGRDVFAIAVTTAAGPIEGEGEVGGLEMY